MSKIKNSKKEKKKSFLSNQYNKSIKSFIKTLIKKMNNFLKEKNGNAIKENIKILISNLDKARRKKIFHYNKINRIKSNIMRKIYNFQKNFSKE